MGATSVTGVGQGMAVRQNRAAMDQARKPENNGGCGCSTSETTSTTKPKSIGCVTKHASGGKTALKVGSSTTIKVCS